MGQEQNHRNTQKQMPVKAQHTKTYEIQKKKCSEGNLYPLMPTLKKDERLKIHSLILHFKELDKEE